MTAPLTPPHQPPPHDPWQSPRWGGEPHPAPGSGDGEKTDLPAELGQAAAVAALVTVLGVGLGLLWLWLAPRVPLIADSQAVFLQDSEGEEAIGADGTFALLALGFGVVTALLVFWFRRRGGIAVVAGLAIGGVLGSLLAWRLGIWLGPTQDVVAHARSVGKGVVFDAPLKLNAKGVLLVWPMAAMIVHLAVTAVFAPREPMPEWGYPGGAPGTWAGAGTGAGPWATPGAGTGGGGDGDTGPGAATGTGGDGGTGASAGAAPPDVPRDASHEASHDTAYDTPRSGSEDGSGDPGGPTPPAKP